ncbi:MAG TPA: hypothetical protein PKD86_08585 [Gemmatales bacterium]|nr:hypothetical protein [Gemmatales bacterium]HMP59395.1 hypothetical protein [Gemmatales bacterium]
MPQRDEADMTEDLSLFETAVHARPVKLQEPALDVVIVALDGSNQDGTARAVATALAERVGARVEEHSAAQTAADVQQYCHIHQGSLVVVPAPFGTDRSDLRDESLGSVVDMLLMECPVPLLCVRDVLDGEAVKAVVKNLLIPLHVPDEGATRAASWALKLLARGGRLDLLAVADLDVIGEAQKLLGKAIATEATETEALGLAAIKEFGNLIGPVQKRGESLGLTVHVESRVGRGSQVVLESANASPRLLVTSAPKDHTAPAFHRAMDLVLGSRGPVLVV